MNKEEMAEKLKTWEESNLKLKNDLEEASKQLINSCNDLTYNKTELIKSRREINVRRRRRLRSILGPNSNDFFAYLFRN